MEKIYLDYAATTPVDKEVLASMLPFFDHNFGNASEIHDWGNQAKIAIEEARTKIARLLGAKEKEIVFTSCATESINLAHKGLVEEFKIKNSKFKNRLHIITTSIEHKAVLETCKHLEKLGWAEVTYLPVDKHGLISLEELREAIKPETVLVSIMYVNNEVGTTEPIREVGKMLKGINTVRLSSNLSPIYFHTDATQAIQSQDCDVNKLGADLLSFTGHKFYAPKGIGVLFVRDGVQIVRQQDGGGQESKMRAGTENVPYIVGLGKAVALVINDKEQESKRLSTLRDELIAGMLSIPEVELTGHPTSRAPHIASFIVHGVEGEALLLMLNEYGIAASTGSACTSQSLSASHVLTAMGYPPERSHGSLRFSLGKQTTTENIKTVLEVVSKVINQLRVMAPKFENNYV